MAAFSTSCIVIEVAPNPGLKTIIIETPVTTANTDTITLSTSSIGMQALGLLSIEGWAHTLAHSIIVLDPATTVVTAGELVITVPTLNDTCKRVYKITGTSA